MAISAILTIFLTEPKWSLNINSCGVTNFSDFYTLFHNPSPGYEKTLICTQEAGKMLTIFNDSVLMKIYSFSHPIAVYPLQTMVLIFYLFCVTFMMIFRPGLNARYMKNGKIAIYYALYIFPILSVIHAVASGLICKY